MLCIGSWMQPYTDTPAEGWPRFWEIGVTLSGYCAMMSWLRLFSTDDCIPLSHYIYIKCLSTLGCCEYLMDAALHWYTSWGWAQILGNWGNSEWIWCHDVMVEVVKHPRGHPNFTLYPYNVFQHLKMLWIAYGCSLTLIHRLTVGPDFRKIGSGWVKMMSWCQGWGC
jgi:hypothetical protein